ncbi:MAG TPA: type II CAAX endopeptidase family protein [Vicinamibacterales bacterium]|nr:type II CAAX endopeptidase family protein [Vicinamibacterales bacterium]
MLPDETASGGDARPRRPAPVERAAAAFEVLVCSGFPTQLVIIQVLTVFGLHPTLSGGRMSPPFIFSLTLLDTVLLVGFALFFLRAHGESARGVLFGPRPIGRELLFGIVLIPVSFVLIVAVLLVVQLFAPALHNVLHNPLADLIRTPLDAVLFAFVAMIAGGVREEVQRGFVLHRFEQYLGGGTVGIVLFSMVFGLGHLEQGYDVAIATAALGAFWGILYLVRRSIAAPMVAHAGFNLLQVVKFLMVG